MSRECGRDDNDPSNRVTFHPNLVGVSMPFKREEWDDGYAVIKEECTKLGLKPQRVDEYVRSGIVIRDITELIGNAEFLIFDLSAERQNVYSTTMPRLRRSGRGRFPISQEIGARWASPVQLQDHARPEGNNGTGYRPLHSAKNPDIAMLPTPSHRTDAPRSAVSGLARLLYRQPGRVALECCGQPIVGTSIKP